MPTDAHRPTILIVDDTPGNINVLGNTLKKAGYAAIAATNGRQAIQVAEVRNPDLILLDVEMPGLNGFEVCGRLKGNSATARIPVIFLTAKAESADLVKGFENGAVDYVTKPFNSAELLARVRTHLELKFTTERLLVREQELTSLTRKLEEANHVLTNLSLIDSLTGIGNRRQFDQAMEVEWQRSLRNHKPIGLIMIDIDHFKAYNDTYGHQAGDDCLKKVAAALKHSSIRSSDTLARYGGEEFAMILPETDRDGVLKIANDALKQIAALELPHLASPTGGYVSISLGAVSVRPGESGGFEELVRNADESLYRAKNNGRNRVETA